MDSSHRKDSELPHKPEQDMPWRVAPRLEGVEKNRGIKKQQKKKK